MVGDRQMGSRYPVHVASNGWTKHTAIALLFPLVLRELQRISTRQERNKLIVSIRPMVKLRIALWTTDVLASLDIRNRCSVYYDLVTVAEYWWTPVLPNALRFPLVFCEL